MLLFAPLYAPLLFALIPKRLRGLRIAVAVIGIACNILMVAAAFYYGTKYRRNGQKRMGSFKVHSVRTSFAGGVPDDLEDAEGTWERDSGVL